MTIRKQSALRMTSSAALSYEILSPFLRTAVLTLQCALLWPLFIHLPMWLVAFCVMGMSLRGWFNYRRQAAAPRWLVACLFVMVFAGLIVEVMAQSFSLTVNLSFFVMLYVLKALELKTHKDMLWLLYISTVLIACVFFVNQSLLISAYLLLCFICLLGVLALSYRRADVASFFWGDLKHSVKLVFQSLPVMLFLLVFVPRIDPLWSVPMIQEGHRTGMGDTLNPGSISKLLESNELVFRARFTTRAPADDELYWRGLVLSHFDGQVWRTSESLELEDRLSTAQSSAQPNSELNDNEVSLNERQLRTASAFVQTMTQSDYQLILESSESQWVYGLAAPIAVRSQRRGSAQGNAIVLDRAVQTSVGLTMFAPNKDGQRVEISMAVLPRTLLEQGLSERSRVNNTQLPVGSNPQSEAQAERWFASVNGNAQEYVALLMRWISDSPFYYTLEPPQLPNKDFVDAFWFGSRQGFCEHYASAVTFLLRAVGIPARVVVGYHGGTTADERQLISVRQRNAHAWLEWWTGSAWQRLDPTASIAPERVMKNAQSMFRNSSSELSSGLSSWSAGMGALTFVRARWDAMNYQWSSWALGFDESQRKSVLSDWLGGLSTTHLAQGVAKALGVIFLFMLLNSWLFKTRRARSGSKWVSRYLQLQALLPLDDVLLARLTPSEWSRNVQNRYPMLAKDVARYVYYFNALEYRVPNQAHSLNDVDNKLERDLIVAYNQCANRLRWRIFWFKLTQFIAFK
ncbi:MAG: DUF3488 and transglutaminase-like domain-containing protein [Pseudomonadota bacterium]